MENSIVVPFDLETAKKINIGEIAGRIVTEKGQRTGMKNILLKISQKRILDGIGEDIPYQKNPLIK